MSPTLVNAAVADARAALLELGGRDSTVIAALAKRHNYRS